MSGELGVARQEGGEHGQAARHGPAGTWPGQEVEGVDKRVVDGLLLGVERCVQVRRPLVSASGTEGGRRALQVRLIAELVALMCYCV